MRRLAHFLYPDANPLMEITISNLEFYCRLSKTNLALSSVWSVYRPLILLSTGMKALTRAWKTIKFFTSTWKAIKYLVASLPTMSSTVMWNCFPFCNLLNCSLLRVYFDLEQVFHWLPKEIIIAVEFENINLYISLQLAKPSNGQINIYNCIKIY